MPKTQTTKVDVAILGRTYRVTCAADELDALQAAARRVDVAMRQVQRAGVALSLDRIAVMAALNIANGHFAEDDAAQAAAPQLQRLTAKLDAALEP
ncbi:MAG: cell division protein ZapA [Gammaproteobacteria bacterium]|nr:cell division protein ZapA [Gammaproteobacteria bacterium]